MCRMTSNEVLVVGQRIIGDVVNAHARHVYDRLQNAAVVARQEVSGAVGVHECRRGAAGLGRAGMVTTNWVPSLASLRTLMSPPRSSTKRVAMRKPKPKPRNRRRAAV